jgi:hypothetical protein
MRVLDTDQIKLALKSTKVMGYRKEVRESHSKGSSATEGTSSGRGGSHFAGASTSDGTNRSNSFNPDHPDNEWYLQRPCSTAEGWNQTVADTSGDTDSWSEQETSSRTTSESTTTTTVDVPVMGQELSSVQYRSIDEQLFRAMQMLFDQEDRHFAVRFPGGPKAPIFVKTPTVPPATTKRESVEKYRERLLEKLPFALRMPDALQRLNAREQKLLTEFVELPLTNEPKTAKRRVR